MNPSLDMLGPVIALVVWSMVMWVWMYTTRIPAMFAAKMTPDPETPGTFRVVGVLAVTIILLIAGKAVAQAAPVKEALSRQDQAVFQVIAYHPQGKLCRGVAIISPGAGGSETGYQYLGQAMSALGYMAVVVGHPESGRSALREHGRGKSLSEGLSALLMDPEAYRGRFMDIAAARKWAAGACQGSEAVLVGHSMGAATVMIAAGVKNALGIQGMAPFDAYVALSPQGVGMLFPPNAWADLKRPVLSLTGTRDDVLGGASWETRTEPYKNMPAGCKWLGVINNATHLHFAGIGWSRRSEALTTHVIGAFLEGVRKGDCQAPQGLKGIDLQSK